VELETLPQDSHQGLDTELAEARDAGYAEEVHDLGAAELRNQEEAGLATLLP